jgi:hypothetical protein
MSDISGRATAMSSMRGKRTETPQHILDRFEKHATEIGHLVFAWARLQQNLGHLFAAVVRASDPQIGLGIWGALKSDRTQRDILEAAAKVVLADRPDAEADVLWLLKAAGDRTTGRNDAVHTAFLFTTDDDGDIVPVPDVVNSPGRLERFKDKDLPELFARQRDDLTELYRFTAALTDQFLPIEGERPPWPERPQLRSSDQPPSRKGERRQNAPKRPERQPRPSRV